MNHNFLRYLDPSNRGKNNENGVWVSFKNKLIRTDAEGEKHFRLKKKLFEFLMLQDNPDIRCECVFLNGSGKADLIDFTQTFQPAIVYEIAVTELKGSLDKKKKTYPCNLFKFRVIKEEDDITSEVL